MVKGDREKYKVETICHRMVYASKSGVHLLGLYYLVLWKFYLKKKKNRGSTSMMLYFYKLLSTFYRNNSEILTTWSTLIYFTPLMVSSTIWPTKASDTKQNWGRPTKDNDTNKHTKKIWTFNCYLVFGLVLIVGNRYLKHVTFRYLRIFQPYSLFGFSSPTLARRFFLWTYFLYSINSFLAHPLGLGNCVKSCDFLLRSPIRF